MASVHASLDAAATERKARLAKLTALKRKQPPSDEESHSTESRSNGWANQSQHHVSNQPSKETIQHLSGRNYDIDTRGPRLGFESAPSEDQETIEDRAAAIALETKKTEEAEEREEKPLDLFTLQPKKPNWDLKRDLERKMAVLYGRTDNAVAKLVRERIDSQRMKEHSLNMNGSQLGNGEVDEGEDSVGIKGIDLVEGVHVREQGEKEEEMREREADEYVI